MSMTYAVCIFARNEERLLPRCVAALSAAGLPADGEIHILVNGCTDNTALVAKMLATADPRIAVHELPVGDKANAWNDYGHRIANPDIGAHIFIDGDIQPSEGAVAALGDALTEAPEAYGAAALPVTGRSRRSWAATLLLNNYLSGNLYALSNSAIEAFRARQLRLPYGAKGEDGLISYILLTDFDGGTDDSHAHRIIVAEDATFEFDSLEANFRDLKIYRRRLKRYSERHFQKQLLYGLLKARGAGAMPDDISEIYTTDALAALKPRREPVNFWFDFATLRRLRDGATTATKTI